MRVDDSNLQLSELYNITKWQPKKAAVEKCDIAQELRIWREGYDVIKFQLLKHDGKPSKIFQATLEQFEERPPNLFLEDLVALL